MKKLEYKGGRCPYCSTEDIFAEWSHIQLVIDYARKSHSCYNCASKALQKNIKSQKDSKK
jgi:DNA-directed RNA polymerase subunit RPC12/RpoP